MLLLLFNTDITLPAIMLTAAFAASLTLAAANEDTTLALTPID